MPTYSIDTSGQGNFSSIAQALEQAQPGDIFRIRPGIYLDGLHLNRARLRNLTFIGDSNAADIVIDVSGQHALLFATYAGVVANLTLRHHGEGIWPTVEISQGRLELTRCIISGDGEAGVLIQGRANPLLRGNHITNTHGHGLMFYEAYGMVEDNHIVGNGSNGIVIMRDSNPVLHRNQICRNRGRGIAIEEFGEGLIEANEICDNGDLGVYIATENIPSIRRNRITGHPHYGIEVDYNGRAVIEANDLRGNGLRG
jgi:nitrous oxidase accessory protein NosD